MSKNFLNREAFAKAPILKFEDIACPELGEGAFVRIQELTAGAAQQFGDRVSKEDDRFAMPLWVIASAVDPETGKPIFTDTPEDREMILGQGASVVMRLGNAALRLNGFTKEAGEAETKN